jgi:hypothetical protein
MDSEISRLRADALRLAQGKPPTQVRYPDAFRQDAISLGRQRLAQGWSVTRAALELGVSAPTLTKWLRPPAAAPTLRPVTVASEPLLPAGAGPVLITPNGVRVTGLDRDTLVAVLQALG